jgi:hypothetical protein
MSSCRVARSIVAAVFASAFCSPSVALAKPQAIPVVKCPFETMTGTEAVSAPKSVSAELPAALSGRVAYYTVGLAAVFAPRGWKCVGRAGSSGVTLVVAPGSVPSGDLTKQLGVEMKLASGGTSGRATVASEGGALFPTLRTLANRWSNGDPLLKTVSTQPRRGESVTPASSKVARFCDPRGVRGVGDGSGGAYATCGIATIVGAIPSGQGTENFPDLRIVSVTMQDQATTSAFVTLNGH